MKSRLMRLSIVGGRKECARPSREKESLKGPAKAREREECSRVRKPILQTTVYTLVHIEDVHCRGQRKRFGESRGSAASGCMLRHDAYSTAFYI